MDLGIGLPTAVRGVDGKTVLEWARRGERCGFSTLAASDRLVYDTFEPLTALAGAAGVTERIRLTTSVVLAPLRTNAALFAKQAATVDRLSNGRLVLGVAVGGREDDFEFSHVPLEGRGRTFVAQLQEMKQVWRGEAKGMAGPIGPAPVRAGGPQLILGGTVAPTAKRVARFADGWIGGGGGPQAVKQTADAVREAWKAAGRAGEPRIISLTHFALGPDGREKCRAALHHYYAFRGEYAQRVADSAVVDEAGARKYIEDFAAIGCDELLFLPCNGDPAQVEQLAELVMPRH